MRRTRLTFWTFTLLLGAVTLSWSQSITVLHNFTGGNDGADPLADLVSDPTTGLLFGTTNNGGGAAACPKGCGTVFAIQPDGSSYSVLYRFMGRPNSDGANPQAGLVEDASGNLYGTTFNGGPNGLGTVFELSPVGGGQYRERVLYAFSGPDGSHPTARLLFNSAGDLIGTTSVGGSHGRGIVFELTPTQSPPWREAVLHNFAGRDGSNPRAGLFAGPNGSLWGTTYHGGASNRGVVFALDLSGTETFLFSFNGSDGANPRGALVFDSAGDVFGTTQFGGSPCTFAAAGCGVVFEIQTSTGGFSVLYNFTGGADGAQPLDDLTLVPDLGGNDLFGTASRAGNIGGTCLAAGCGTLFELCSSNTSCQGSGAWAEYTVFDFQKIDGRIPAAGLYVPGGIQGDGPQGGRGSCTASCFGTASSGGASGSGTVYSVGP